MFAPNRYPLLFLTVFVLVVGSLGCDGSTPTEPDRDIPDVDPFEMNARLARGVNFGNALEAPREGEWGITLDARQFQRAKEAGFNTIRLPVRWSNHASSTAPYTIDASFFNRVDWAINQALSRDMNVILNVHHYEEMASNPRDHRDRWLGLWKQIAEHYRNYDENLLFELLNEPNNQLTASLWNEFLDACIQEIRLTNPTRNLIVGPVFWNNTNSLPQLQLPADDDNLIVTIHFYEPFMFTHQGAEWVNGADAWLGTQWFGTTQDQAFVTNILERAAAWGTTNNRPLFLGEFGAYSQADMFSRVRWTDYVAREAERLGMSWSYWEFMSGFGIYNISNDSWNEALRDALLPPATTAVAKR